MRPIVAIVGPTAAGKSRLALELAERLGGEILNADALQVYRGFDIGTGKPDAEDRARVRHHLIDILEPSEPCSAGEYARQARSAIAAIESRRRLPIVVGGSGLYLRALLDGISPVPAGDPAVRQRLRRRLAEEGLPALRAELLRLDPGTAARLPAGDTQRTLRALEVAWTSGRPLASWIARQPFGQNRLAALRLGLTLPRAILYDRIAVRVARMVADGWVREVEALLDCGLSPRLPAFQAIGYRQIAHHLLGGCTLEAALEETVRATRRLAKRQLTWFRKEPEVVWFQATEPERRVSEILEFLRAAGVGES
jgi:tRNA dimethylallyltransferase